MGSGGCADYLPRDGPPALAAQHKSAGDRKTIDPQRLGPSNRPQA